MDRIALAVDSDGKLAEFFSITKILIYEKQNEWTVVESYFVSEELDTSSAAAVRQKAEAIGRNILEKNCKIMIGREIIGIPYHTLCKANLEVFEADEISIELLDAIYKDFLLKEDKPEEEIEMVPPRPIPTDDESNYYFDFIKAIKCHPELSSKKMLLPFLTNDLFYSLIIRCEHIMPWLDDFVKSHGLNMETKREDGIYHALITHRSCNE